MPTTTRKSAREKILEFSHFTKGWDFGEGIPFTRDTIRRALFLNRLLMAKCTPETDAFPGAGGDIMVTAYRDQWSWEILIDASGTVTYVVERNDVVIDRREDVSFDEALEIARRLITQTWKSYASSTPLDLTPESNALLVWRSSPRRPNRGGLRASLPSASNVFTTSAAHPVATYGNTINTQLAPLQSFGSSTLLYCQTSVS